MSDRFVRANDPFERYISDQRFARIESMWQERRDDAAKNGPRDEFTERDLARARLALDEANSISLTHFGIHDAIVDVDLAKPPRFTLKPHKLAGKFRVHWDGAHEFEAEYVDGELTPESRDRVAAFMHAMSPRVDAIVDRDPGDEDGAA